jgi:AcrR family transcriptional regulator
MPMMRNKTDRRAARTRSALLDAFAHLVHERLNIDEVSIGDIVERANVGRSTFYEHFKNKEDILATSFQSMFVLLSGLTHRNWSVGEVTERLNYWWEHRELVRSLYSGANRRSMARVLARSIADNLRHTKIANTKMPARIVSVALAEAQVGTIHAWLTGQLYCTPTQLAETLMHLSRSCAGSK